MLYFSNFTKGKRQAIILTMSYIKYLQVFDSKSDLEFLILDCNIQIILKIIKDRFHDTKEIQYLYKTTQHKSKVRSKRRDCSSNLRHLTCMKFSFIQEGVL